MDTYQTYKMTLGDVHCRLAMDISMIVGDPLSRIFPFIKGTTLLQPYKSLYNNMNNIYTALRKMCDESKDEKSVFRRLMALGKFEVEDVYNDTMALLSAGMDTSGDFIAMVMYYLYKFPAKKAKLMEELAESKLDCLKHAEVAPEDIADLHVRLNSCNYLNYVLKEVLRLDTPGPWSIKYIAKEDVTIRGVPVPKDTLLSYFSLGPQHDPEQWHKTMEFIPERFDPESIYLSKPGLSKEARHPKAWVPFSPGPRTCPGKALAVFETKLVIARMLHQIDYTIDQELLDTDKMRFNLHSVQRSTGVVVKSMGV